MAWSNAKTYTSRRSNHAESSTTGARRNVRAESDRDRTESEGGSESEDDEAELQSRPTQRTVPTGTQGGATESHQSRAAANMKAEMGHRVSNSSLFSYHGRLGSLYDPDCHQAYERLVSETINMALYATHRRQAIKKDDINKKSTSEDFPAQS
jgi:hypothetical protein